mmetsp:Transcript_29955/g.73729  ORF Transcript_29955/g.73729 Transcript_29955/m.73729 type:complete len:295 (+) Transcript_29955:34-918(+)
MAKLQLNGSYVALVTPFTDSDEVDYAKIEELVEMHVQQGTAGIVPCGTTGENPCLTDEENLKVIETCVKKAAKRIQIIAGAGTNNTKKAVKLAQQCKDAGADCILTCIPYYNKPTQEGMIEHFKAIAAVGIPMMLYNIPGRCGGGGMTSATIAELYKLPAVCSVKEATGSVDFASEIASVCDIQIFSGDDSLTVPLMAVGAKGVVSVVANIAPKAMANLCKTMDAGDIASARKQHFEIYKVCKAMFVSTNPIPVKAAGAMMGLWQNNLRLPMTRLPKEHEPQLKSALQVAGLLK